MVSATELGGSAVVGWVVRDVTCAQVYCREVDCCEFVCVGSLRSGNCFRW